jgi:cytochrome c-type biogenesis protein
MGGVGNSRWLSPCSRTVAIHDVGLSAYAIAFGGGVISFLSPCVLPLVPAYLSVVSGINLAADADQRARGQVGRIAATTATFIGGFTVVFVLLGLSATSIGRVVFTNQLLLTRVSGVMVMAMGMFLLGSIVLESPWMYREARFHPQLGRYGAFAPAVAGMAFGFGWTPCIGPVLGSILAIAAARDRVWSGATLLAVYSAGLGLPFLVSGIAMHRLTRVFGWVRRHLRGISLISGGSLVLLGALLVFNRLIWLTTQLQSLLRVVGLDRLVRLG